MSSQFQTISGQDSTQISPPSTKLQQDNMNKKQIYIIKGSIPNALAQTYESGQKYFGGSAESKGLQSVNLSLSISNKGQNSGAKQNSKALLQRGDIQQKSQDDIFSGSAEKSYADASVKIMKIKQIELDNKIHLLTIENERLTNFLHDSVGESERLNEEVYQWQMVIKQDQEKYQQKLNSLLIQNQQLEEVNQKLQNRIHDLLNDKRDLAASFGDEVQQIKNQYLQGKSFEVNREEKNVKDIKHHYENQITQIQDKLNRVEFQNQEQRRELNQKKIFMEELELRINVLISENLTISNIVQNQELNNQTLTSQNENYQHDLKQSKSHNEKEIKDLRLNEKQTLEHLQTQHQIELQNVQKNKFQDMSQQLEELCAELGTKEIKIRNLEKEVLNLQKGNESQRRRDNQNLMDTQENEKQIQSHLEEERGILLQEIQSLFTNQNLLEQAIVKHTKMIVTKEKSLKDMKIKLQESQSEAQKAHKNLLENLNIKESEINSYKSKIDILLSENDTLSSKIRTQQRDYDTLAAKFTSIDMELEQRLKKTRHEFNNQKDQQLELIYKEQLDNLKNEHIAVEKLERIINDQQQVRTSLETQLIQLKQSDALSDNKIQELLKQNDLLERENFQYRDEALTSQKDTKIAQTRLMQVEKNYELEKNDLRKQVLAVTQQNECLKQVNESLQTNLEECEYQLNQMNVEFDKLKNGKAKALTETYQLADKYTALEKENNKNREIIKSQQFQINNLHHEVKQLSESFQKNFFQREADLLNKIQEQQSYIGSISSKYDDLLQKARKYRQHILLLREAAYNGKGQQSDDLTSTKKRRVDSIDDDMNDGESLSNMKYNSLPSQYQTKNLSQFKSPQRNDQQQVVTIAQRQQKGQLRPSSVQRF